MKLTKAMHKDLEISFSELTKLTTENEAALQRQGHVLEEQTKQLEGIAEEKCLDIEKVFEQNVNVQSKIFQAKQKPALEIVNKQLRTMRDTFTIEYELSSNLPGLQWTWLGFEVTSRAEHP